MKTYLGLGSNLGDRISNLRSALIALAANGIDIIKVSPIVESPAQLLRGSDPDWNKPFLNLAVQADTSLGPDELLRQAKQIEVELGRDFTHRWSPRPIDIDVLLYDDREIVSEHLTIPHTELHRRAFVLTPLVALDPGLRVPGQGSRSILEISRELGHPIPLWMGIVNVTPDSFSDGGQFDSWPAAEAHIAELHNAGAQFIDLGAESTRPGATPLSAAEEWTRLVAVLEPLMEKFHGDMLRPRISVDTYHPSVARQALSLGVDMINDVSGLTNPEMIELAASTDGEFVAMHNLSLPADPGTTIPAEEDPVRVLEQWLVARLEQWTRAGIDIDRVLFDPGVGFGKTALQSLDILQRVEQFRGHGLRLLIGHSRKSFMRGFSNERQLSRDLTTVGASLSLLTRGADILRVHDVAAHAAAWLGWAHLQKPTGMRTRPR
jgi:2-amino-4-hydroxy-6-hydroxymethyldihydropteridine diphosphokinase/dihydropteroate synthase